MPIDVIEQLHNIPSRYKIGDILFKKGICTEDVINEALMLQKISPDRLLGEILLEKRYITEDDLCMVLAEQYSCKYLPLLDSNLIDESIIEKIDPSKKIFLDKCFLPFKLEEKIKIAVYKPDFEISTILAKAGISEYEIIISSKAIIYEAINSKFFVTNIQRDRQTPEDIIRECVIIASAKKSANIRVKFTPESFFINIDTQFGTIEAIKTVYLEVGRRIIRVLAELCNPKVNLVPGHPASSKFIFEGYDIRIEFIPVESTVGNNIHEAVLRIHYLYSKDMLDFNTLGFDEKDISKLKLIKTMPTGIVIWTGPTGAGKTTTIYASIKDLSATRKQIYMIEDPIENQLSDINITQIAVKDHFGFDAAIRSVLRCEPKILMIGEIRDKNTAEAVAMASDTGHLVLTTIHTNSALSIFTRLTSLGVDTKRIIENINMVMAQRLYISLCDNCKIERELTFIEEEILIDAYDNLSSLFQNIEEIKTVFDRNRTGCSECNRTGYLRNRKAIIEIASFNNETRDMIIKKNTSLDIEKAFIDKRGFVPLSFKSYKLLKDGIIDLNQFYSITNVK